MNVEAVWDSTLQQVVRGEAMLRVIAQEAQKKNLNINQGVWPSWMGASGPESQDHGDRVLTASRQQLHEESARAVMDTVRYQSSIEEVTAAVATQTSLTTTVDGLATGLLQWGGLRVLQNVREFLRQDMGHLPYEVFQALHLPYRKCPGLILNTCSRPIIVTSGCLRLAQKFLFMRLQRLLSPEDLGLFQHAALPGLSCVQLRRIQYNTVVLRVQNGQDILLLFLDLSNGYGQTDRILLGQQVYWTAYLRAAYKQQMVQHRRLQVFIQTALGLAQAYRILRGVVQGGGMDPFFYVWNSLLLWRGINERCRGVLLTLLWGAQVAIKVQATVDDTTLWATSPAELQRAVEQVMPILKAMNAAVNPDKFGLLHLSGAQGQTQPLFSNPPPLLRLASMSPPPPPPRRAIFRSPNPPSPSKSNSSGQVAQIFSFGHAKGPQAAP